VISKLKFQKRFFFPLVRACGAGGKGAILPAGASRPQAIKIFQNRFDYYQLLPTKQEKSNFSHGKIR